MFYITFNLTYLTVNTLLNKIIDFYKIIVIHRSTIGSFQIYLHIFVLFSFIIKLKILKI